MQKVILLIIFTLIFSCKKDNENIKRIVDTKISKSTKSIILDQNCIIFISPSSNKIEAMKKSKGEDFFTMADDANFYYSNAIQFLDSLNRNYMNKNENETLLFKDSNNTLVKIKNNDEGNAWYAILYDNDNKKYKVTGLLSFSEEFKKFYNINSQTNEIVKTFEDFNLEKKGKYSIIKEITCDLNKDNIQDKIVVYKNNKEFVSDDDTTKESPVSVFFGIGNNKFEKFENPKIFGNDSNDFFKNLVVKDIFFTVELYNEVPNKYVINKYITFKYDIDSKKIILFKYGQNLFGDKNETLLYTSKDFGKIYFEQYDSNTILEKV